MKENLLNLIGWKNTRSKRKAFTLVELILSMFIQLILFSLSFKIAMTSYKNYINLINTSKCQDSFDDAILNIDRLLKTQMIESIKIQENRLDNTGKIIITYRIGHITGGSKEKRIFLDDINKKIILQTYKQGQQEVQNVIMREVSSFDIIKKNKIYYLKIKSIYGEERILCL